MEKQIRKKKGIVRQNRTFRLSEYELQKLSEGATAAGMNESKYVRELILHGGVDATHAEARRNLIRQISGIATNINQIAKRCNENKRIDNSDVFRLTFELGDIKKLLQQLMERWR
ncbi:MAG: plasmid mobilization relaxosome protein MobC [Clostridium sp.]|nr:plasmid mobilization relaxosome protein MobC [Clostridium sp.]